MYDPEIILNYKYIWKIENFSMLELNQDKCIQSPSFFTNAEQDMEWIIEMYPRGRVPSENIACYLVTTDGQLQKNICIAYDLKITIAGVNKVFRNKQNNLVVLNNYYYFGNEDIVDRKWFDNLNLPENSLTVECKLSFETNSYKVFIQSYIKELEMLSDNLLTLYKSAENHDFSIPLNEQILDCHSFIIQFRSVELFTRCQGAYDFLPDNPSLNLLKYLYSGKMHNSDMTDELRTFTTGYMHLFDNRTTPMTITAETNILVEKVSLKWVRHEILKPFQRVIPLRQSNASKLLITFIPLQNSLIQPIDIVFQLIRKNGAMQTLLRCKVSLYQEEDLLTFFEANHLYKDIENVPFSEKWRFPQSENKDEVKNLFSKATVLKIDIVLSNHMAHPPTVSTYCKIQTGLQHFSNLRKLSTDLERLYDNSQYTFYDMTFNKSCGSQKGVHFAILSARCPKLNQIFGKILKDNPDYEFQMSNLCDEIVFENILRYLYSGKLCIANHTLERIQKAAEMLEIPGIIKICREYQMMLALK